MRRVRCSRSCLHKSLKVVSLLVNICGVGMIIYSLWLLKKWDEGVAELSSSDRAALPRPWFILVCLALGIIVCLSMLCSHMVANCINKSVLCIYVVSVCSLVLLQGGVVIIIFFKMDMIAELKKYIDNTHQAFRSFIMFHLYMCRLFSIVALVAQINVVGLAVILWMVGTEPVARSDIFDVPDFKHSFLISPYSPLNDEESSTRNTTQVLSGASRILESYF
ncbi:hypothetical protein Ancab_002161 [Ancistrocladus abbreviatus]